MSPCYSTIRTKINNADNLGAALAALGWVVSKDAFNVYAEKGNNCLSFTRNDKQSAFNVSGDTEFLSAVGRKYAEIGSRNWAKRAGFNVLDNEEGVGLTLIRRTI